MTQQRVSPVSITSVLPATVTLSVQGALGQSANLIEARNNAGAIVFSVTSGGAFGQQVTAAAGVDVVGGSLGLRSIAGAATVVPILARGAVSQTGDLFQAQNSAGTSVALITASGRFATSIISNVANTGTYIDTGSNSISFVQRVAGTVGVIVQGAASQTANLTEWRDSTNTVLAAITASGQIAASSLNTFNFHINATENSGGGRIRFRKLTAASGNPGADLAQLYFRDGTNAGTLKLVVRAGAAGAETTILDNIPQ